MDELKDQIIQNLRTTSGITGKVTFKSAGGGCINDCYRIESANQRFFCKINSATKFPQLFEKEKLGLELISAQQIIRTPDVISVFDWQLWQVMILEYMDEGERNNGFWTLFGEQLARLHQESQQAFGLDHDNYMGSIPQKNEMNQSWVEFYRSWRLEPLVNRCVSENLLEQRHSRLFEKFYQFLPSIFNTDDKPALVHGDLWSGNFMCHTGGQPVLIDPAVYYGHPAMDLGMTMLFGGFDKRFYDSYKSNKASHEITTDQCLAAQLYPLLVHVLLFGRSYVPALENILKRFCHTP